MDSRAPVPLEQSSAPPKAPWLYLRLRAWLEAPHALLRISALAFVLALPAIATGLVTDDYALEAAVQRDVWGAFEFYPREPLRRQAEVAERRAAGSLPWWVNEQLEHAVMRPLSSLSHALDFRLWPRAVPLMHVENAALYALLVWLTGTIYAQLGASRAATGLATFFFATTAHHAMSVAWLAGRNTLLAAAFGLLSVSLELRATHDPNRTTKRWLGVASSAAFGCALLSAEIGVSAAGYLLALALMLRTGPITQRLASLWPHAVIAVAWQVAYVACGYGASGSDFYRGPAQEPGMFVAGVLSGAPIYLATQLTLPVATFAGMFPDALWRATLLSVALLLLLRPAFLPLLHAQPSARFLLLGALLSTIPLAASMPQDRLVPFVRFGTAGLLGSLIAQLPTAIGRRRWLLSRLFRLHALYLPVLFIPLLFSSAMANGVGGGTEALARALPTGSGRGAVLLNAPSELPVYFQHLIRARRKQPPIPSLSLLYAGAQPVEILRSDARSLELNVTRGYLRTTLERISRNPLRVPFQAGDAVALPSMHVQVLTVNAEGLPTRVRFEFPAALERLPVDFLCWHGKLPRPCQPPEIGRHLSLPALSAL